MVENMALRVLKEGMKTWIVTTRRIQAGFAQLREELDDVVAEARDEYERRADNAAGHRAERHAHGDAKSTTSKVAKPKASRPSGSRTGTPRGTKTTKAAG